MLYDINLIKRIKYQNLNTPIYAHSNVKNLTYTTYQMAYQKIKLWKWSNLVPVLAHYIYICEHSCL